MSHELPHDVLLAIKGRNVKGCHAELAAQVPERDVLLDKLRDDGGVPVPGGQVDRRHPGLVLVQRRGAVTDEQLDHVSVAALGGHVQRGAVGDPVPARGHDALVKLEQLLQHPHTPLLGSNVGRSVPILKWHGIQLSFDMGKDWIFQDNIKFNIPLLWW